MWGFLHFQMRRFPFPVCASWNLCLFLQGLPVRALYAIVRASLDRLRAGGAGYAGTPGAVGQCAKDTCAYKAASSNQQIEESLGLI